PGVDVGAVAGPPMGAGAERHRRGPARGRRHRRAAGPVRRAVLPDRGRPADPAGDRAATLPRAPVVARRGPGAPPWPLVAVLRSPPRHRPVGPGRTTRRWSDNTPLIR